MGGRLGARGRAYRARCIAPGHDRPRCVYVDFLNTGPAVAATLRARRSAQTPAIRRVGDLCVTDLVVRGGAVARRGRAAICRPASR